MRGAIAFVSMLLVASQVSAASHTLHLQVDAASSDRSVVPIKIVVNVPEALARIRHAQLAVGGEPMWGQLTAPSLLRATATAPQGEVARELHFILPRVKAGETIHVEATVSSDLPQPDEHFTWHTRDSKLTDLTFAGKLVARYMNDEYDRSTSESRERTYKVYHHVFAPDGESLLTKGPGGKYTHHRGIFYGFNKCSYGEGGAKTADIWHCKGNVRQLQQGTPASEMGPVLARTCLAIAWIGDDNKLFASELREVTFFHTPDGLLVEFESKLKSVDGKLKVDGDPQHAGFHFRAANEVAEKTAGQTYYIRPNGVDKPGSYKQNQQQPWNAMSFVVGDQRYTTCYLDHPSNPKPAFYSERDYGRFGSYFVAEAEGDQTIDVDYRLWIQPGEMTVEQVAAHAANFTEPLKGTVK